MMNSAFRREAVNAVYLALHAKSMKDLLACVQDIPIRGLSVTMPYKQEMVAALENSDPLTRQIGACNTVVRAADGKLYGFNTDVAGIVVPLEQRLSSGRRTGPDRRRRRRGARGSLRAEGQRRGSLHRQSHGGERPDAGPAGEGEVHQASPTSPSRSSMSSSMPRRSA